MVTTPDSPAKIASQIVPVVSVSDLLTKITPGHATVYDFHDGKLEVTLKQLPPDEPKVRPRAETLARAHDFCEADTFAQYVKQYGASGTTVVFIDPNQEKAWAVLDEAVAGGREILTFRPAVHPLAKPWLDLCKRGVVALADFRDFLMVNRRAVRQPDGRKLALVMQQIKASVQVEVHDGRGKDALNGLTVKTSIAGVDQKEFVQLPERIVVNVPLYVGGEPLDIELDLLVEANARGEIVVQIAAGGLAEARILAFDAMQAGIRETLGAKGQVCFGEPKQEKWRYLGRAVADPD